MSALPKTGNSNIAVIPTTQVLDSRGVGRHGVWARICRDKLTLLWLGLATVIVLAALLAPWLAPHDPYLTKLMISRKPPGWTSPEGVTYWLGTDIQGRDLLSRVLYGLRATLFVGLVGVVVGSGIGAMLGILAAYYARATSLIMRVADVLLSFPAILFGLSLSALMGPGMPSLLIALSLAAIPGMIRVARSAAMTVIKQDYMEAGRSVGFSDGYLLTRYVLPNCASMLLIYATLQLGHTILLASLLSFLGLGPLPPFAELGSMAADGRKYLEIFPHISTIPTLTIFAVVLVVNLLGDSLRDAFDLRIQS